MDQESADQGISVREGGRQQEQEQEPASAQSQCIQVELMGSYRKRLNVSAPS